MPWEGQALTFRWEVFNLTNTQRFTGFNGTGLNTDPFIFGGAPPPGFGQFTGTQAPLGENRAGRVIQFALRYVFQRNRNVAKYRSWGAVPSSIVFPQKHKTHKN